MALSVVSVASLVVTFLWLGLLSGLPDLVSGLSVLVFVFVFLVVCQYFVFFGLLSGCVSIAWSVIAFPYLGCVFYGLVSGKISWHFFEFVCCDVFVAESVVCWLRF